MSLGPSFINTTRRARPKSYLRCRRRKSLCSSVCFLPRHCERDSWNSCRFTVQHVVDASDALQIFRVRCLDTESRPNSFLCQRRQCPLVGAGTHSGLQLCEVCICGQSIKCPRNSTSPNPRLSPSHYVASICMLSPPQDLVARLTWVLNCSPTVWRASNYRLWWAQTMGFIF